MQKRDYYLKNFFAFFFAVTAVLAYRNSLNLIYELTFLSNFACGILLAADGPLEYYLNKRVPAIFYQITLIITNVVFCSCIFTLFGIHSFTFKGAFFFLHAVNPVIFFLLYIFTTHLEIKNKKDFWIKMLISPSVLLVYFIVDLIRFYSTGKLVYWLIAEQYMGNNVFVAIFSVLFCIFLFLMSFGLQKLKLYEQKKIGG